MNTDQITAFFKNHEVIGCILLGILGNLITHWLISGLPPQYKNWRSKFSEKWRTLSEKKRLEREKRIAALLNNPQEQQIILSLAEAKRHAGKVGILVSLLMLIFALFAVNRLCYITDKTSWKEIVFTAIMLVIALVLTAICFHFTGNDFEEASTMVDDVKDARRRKGLRVD